MGLFTALAIASTPIRANTTEIVNQRGTKVKFCAYRSDDKSLIRPRECWVLRKNQKVKWNRGDARFDLDVRIFEPGAFELPICLKQDIPYSYRIEVAPRETKTCVVAYQRAAVPEKNRAEGEKILVNRAGDDFWYPATILGKAENGYRVLLANGLLVEAFAEHLLDDDIVAESRIFVNWKKQGRWYRGSVLSRKGDRLVVKYDDGWTEDADLANVRLGSEDIMKIQQPIDLINN